MATTKRKTTKTASKRAAATSNGPDWGMIGRYTFLGGLGVAVVAGILFAAPTFITMSWQAPVVYLLSLLAIVGGWLFISKEAENGFFILALALHTFSNTLSFLPVVGPYIVGVLGAVAMFIVIAALTVAVRRIVSWFSI